METRNFGKSDLKTSAVGFGGWPMGRGHYGSFDEDEVVRSIHAAIDAGVTLFDTAAVYGWGEGETLLGRALTGKGDPVGLASKGGLDWGVTGDMCGGECCGGGLTFSVARPASVHRGWGPPPSGAGAAEPFQSWP